MGRVERMQGWKRYQSQYLLQPFTHCRFNLNFLATDTINLFQNTVVNVLLKVRSFLRWILQGGKDATTMKKISGMLKNGKVGKLIHMIVFSSGWLKLNDSSGVFGFKEQGGKEEHSEEKHNCCDPEEGTYNSIGEPCFCFLLSKYSRATLL